MAVHPIGDGAAWAEDVDVDQPHGLDYRYENHIAKAVRLRMEKGHKAFGDATAGGEHIPGGAGVLGVEITNDAGDPTAAIVSDGTYMGRGLVWMVEDDTSYSVLWCSTAGAESTAATDWTILAMNPDKQWKGGDVSWQGNHQFDSSVQFYDPVDFTGSVHFDGTVDFSGSVTQFHETVRFSDGTSTIVVADDSLVVDNTTADKGIRFDCSVTFDTTMQLASGGVFGIDAATLSIQNGAELDIQSGGLISICGDVSAHDGASCTWAVFGAEVSTDGDGGDIVVGTRYHTNTDGFVIVSDWSRSPTLPLTLQADYSLDLDPVSTVIADRDGEVNYSAGYTYPVSSCQYFCLSTNVGATAPEKYLWKPIGGGDLSAQ